MRNLGETWDTIWALERKNIRIRKRVIINSRVYYEDEIYDLTKQNALIDRDFGIGNCIAGKLDLIIHSPEDESALIPKNAKVQLQIMLEDITGIERGGKIFVEAGGKNFVVQGGKNFIVRRYIPRIDWVNFGTFFIDTRAQVGNRLVLECYDAMLYATGIPFFFDGDLLGDFPHPTIPALEHACRALTIESGVDIIIDPRTNIRAGSVIQFPGFVGADNPEFKAHKSLTMREVLSFIAVEHGGNWTITDDNMLRLVVPVNETPYDTITKGMIKSEITSNPIKFSKVYLVFSEQGDYFAAGDDGTSFEAFSLWATGQGDADRILDILRDYEYFPFEATSAEIDLRLELGDSIEIDGHQSNLWRVTYSNRMFADIEAPISGDIDREFVFNNRHSTTLRRNLSNISGRFATMSLDFTSFQVSIGERVTNLDNTTTSRFATMQMDLDSISLKVEHDYTDLSGEITSLRSEISIERGRIGLLVRGELSESNVEIFCTRITARTAWMNFDVVHLRITGGMSLLGQIQVGQDIPNVTVVSDTHVSTGILGVHNTLAVGGDASFGTIAGRANTTIASNGVVTANRFVSNWTEGGVFQAITDPSQITRDMVNAIQINAIRYNVLVERLSGLGMITNMGV